MSAATIVMGPTPHPLRAIMDAAPSHHLVPGQRVVAESHGRSAGDEHLSSGAVLVAAHGPIHAAPRSTPLLHPGRCRFAAHTTSAGVQA